MTLSIQFAYLTECKEKLTDFSVQHGVLTSTIKYSKCSKVPRKFTTFHAKRSSMQTYVSNFLIVELFLPL